jgi:hypothetical protein
MIYQINYDPAEGHGIETAVFDRLHGTEFNDLEAARTAIPDGLECWSPDLDPDSPEAQDGWSAIEGYYESEDEGCGSYVILGREVTQ